MNKLVVFDLDGTLNKTETFAVAAHTDTLLEYGVTDITPQQIIATFGDRAQDYVKILMKDKTEEERKEYLLKEAQREDIYIKTLGKTFDNIIPMLQALKNQGYKTAICSNAPYKYIDMVASALKIADLIDYYRELLPNVTKNDTLKMLLDKVKPEKAVMVGDRKHDKYAARHNNIPFIGCLYGYNPEEIIDADITVIDPIFIVDAVDKLIGDNN